MSVPSEFSSYVYIKNDLRSLGWNTGNPNKKPDGQLYTQQECLENPDIKVQLVKQKPEYIVKILEDVFWVIEAKGTREKIDLAVSEAKNYAIDINKSSVVSARIISGVAGNDEDGYLVETLILFPDGSVKPVTYNDKPITGFLSPDQARYLVTNNTSQLNELVTEEYVLLTIAEQINEELHKASINKDLRATVMSAVLLSMVSDTLPNFNASPDVFIKDINNRAEDVLIAHAKREFAEHIELRLPHEEAAKEKYKSAVVKVFFLLRKINIKAAMDGSQDLLGKFYEVFLKYGNGAKDIGIVLTPRHITEFASFILEVNSTDLVFDPACGTGGFLVAAYDKVRREEPLNVEMFKKHKIFGIEQQPNVAALAIVNMIFRGDGKNNIINGDCLALNLERKTRNGELSAEYTKLDNPRKPVTKVLMNPPFALKKSDEQEHTFIDHALKQMADNGLLLTVLPISVMYSGGGDLAWRKELLKGNSVLSVISFPNDLFYPQASVEPVIIILRKGIPHTIDTKTLFVRIEDDGFVKLKKRRLPHNGPNELTTLAPEIKEFLNGRPITEINGQIQTKNIDLHDKNLEIIPQQYLDNGELDLLKLQTEITLLYSEFMFYQIRKELGE